MSGQPPPQHNPLVCGLESDLCPGCRAAPAAPSTDNADDEARQHCNPTWPPRPVRRVLRRAHLRLNALPRLERPADERDILTAAEAQVLVRYGVYSVTDKLLARIDTERELHRMVRRIVRRELEAAIPSIITAVAEVLRRGQ